MAKRAYRLDEATLQRKLAKGRGSGSGPDYKPWHEIQEVPSHGRSARVPGRTTGRMHHVLSDNERAVLLILDRSENVVDIREQYPLDRAVTLRLAETMGIPHPQQDGVPIVMTTDFLIDVCRGGKIRCEAIAVKPATALDQTRTVAKLEIERRYWLEKGVPWRITTDRQISTSREMLALWIHGWTSLDDLDAPYDTYWSDQCDRLAAALGGDRTTPLREVLASIEVQNGALPGDGLTIIRHLLAVGRLKEVGDGFDPLGRIDQLEVVAPRRIDVKGRTSRSRAA